MTVALVVIEAFKLNGSANFEFAVAYHWSIVGDLSFAHLGQKHICTELVGLDQAIL